MPTVLSFMSVEGQNLGMTGASSGLALRGAHLELEHFTRTTPESQGGETSTLDI